MFIDLPGVTGTHPVCGNQSLRIEPPLCGVGLCPACQLFPLPRDTGGNDGAAARKGSIQPCREDRKQTPQASPGLWHEIKLSLEEELGHRTRGVHTSVVLVRTLSSWSLLQSWFCIGAQEVLLEVESPFLQDCCSCLGLICLEALVLESQLAACLEQ